MRSGRELRERFQQVAGAVMAKGVEDTAFYRYTRLVALNEVGSDPDHIATLDVLHETFQRTARNRPLTLLATTTHDTKRSEDARLRIGLLSEIPQRWRESVERLTAGSARHRGAIAPARKPNTSSTRRFSRRSPSMRIAPGPTCSKPLARQRPTPAGSIPIKPTRRISSSLFAA